MVDSFGPENWYSLKQRTIVGSNPSPSFCSTNRFGIILKRKKKHMIQEKKWFEETHGIIQIAINNPCGRFRE